MEDRPLPENERWQPARQRRRTGYRPITTPSGGQANCPVVWQIVDAAKAHRERRGRPAHDSQIYSLGTDRVRPHSLELASKSNNRPAYVEAVMRRNLRTEMRTRDR